MVTITDSTNYIKFDEGNNSFALPKAMIGKIKLQTEKDRILIGYEGKGTGPCRKIIEHSKVSSPSTINVTALYNTILGYL